jgi:NAD(P)-dependent dehydrogenase (short-subunit alcohol dehydrogenase family)
MATRTGASEAMGRFSGRSVIVTGAGQGLGRAIAHRFGAEGASLILVGRRLEMLEETAAGIGPRDVETFCLTADVRNAVEVQTVVNTVMERVGAIDVVVNNAGVDDITPFLDVTEEEWDRVVDTNLKGAFLMSQRAAREMGKRGGGSIVHVSSIDAGGADGTAASYAASKAGMLGLNRAMAVELAPHKIRVNSVSPGFVDTELVESAVGDPKLVEYLRTNFDRVPLRRLIRPEEVAAACAFLASEDASAITGADLTVDAGLTANLYVFESLPSS